MCVPSDYIVEVVAVDEVMAGVPAPHHEGRLRLVVPGGALLEEVAVQRSRRVVDRVPVVVSERYNSNIYI